jgi:replicative DNA helicase
MDTNKALAKTIGIEIEEVKPSKEKTLPKIVEKEKTVENTDQVEDYVLGRKTLRNLIETGTTSLEDMKDLARQSESPRAYEVLSTLMKTISEVTKDLYDLQKKTKELNEPKNPQTDDRGSINVERAVFVGSSSELLRKIKEEQ